ncbi:MAG: bifunctional methylenetetrahydrofolate dehydrogenase/methenyltetrahydrofolate cyclohydrolase FolD [Deltaproteobacteria bacterium]|nr:bifunctional methylenetetrahydrofolate dehydrogenase/methenyltetrahydrofolate cyclohydrolase FolD [Deltaproteobacteria bacterium]
MILLDGNKSSKARLEKLKEKVSAAEKKSGKKPGLAVIRIGEDPASKIYVGKKVKTCSEIGFYSQELHHSEKISESELLKIIQSLNQNPKIHGILTQLPLPKHISEAAVIEAISPEKDVDGFHPINLGRLVAQQNGFVPCTPLGIMNLLVDNKIEIKGKRAVVIGRSRIVGRPISLLLDHAGATVTVVHSQTQNPNEMISSADILVVAVGKPHFVKADQIKKGAVVIDVGINRLADGKIVGDVDFESAKDKVSAITPVPGGVGPMTICTLLENTWKSFERT